MWLNRLGPKLIKILNLKLTKPFSFTFLYRIFLINDVTKYKYDEITFFYTYHIFFVTVQVVQRNILINFIKWAGLIIKSLYNSIYTWITGALCPEFLNGGSKSSGKSGLSSYDDILNLVLLKNWSYLNSKIYNFSFGAFLLEYI